MDAELKKAQLEGRTALVYATNGRSVPWSPIFSRAMPRLINVPKVDRYGCEVHAATRRTTLNPRETMILRVLLQKPLDQYPADVKLQVAFDGTSTMWASAFELLPDTKENR